MAFAYSPKIVTDGLVFAVDAANTKSYPGSGTTWKDLSGNGNDGTLTNGPTFDSGNGGSIVFDGTNDYVNYDYFQLINGTNMCVEAWVTKEDSSYDWIIGQYDASNGWHLIYSEIDGEEGFSLNGRDGSGLYRVSRYNLSQREDKWYHVVGNINYNLWELWVDGVLRNTTDTNYVNNDFTSTARLNIGKYSLSSMYWNGKISHIKVYNRALSDTEITQNYNALKSRYGL